MTIPHQRKAIAMKTFISALLLLGVVAGAEAAITQFDLRGKAGNGLLGGNENGTLLGTPGSGGEVLPGIFFDDTANTLTINVKWGSVNGFTDLTGDTILGHLHGPTASGAPASFNENASVKYTLRGLPGWNDSASAGGFSGTISILAGDVAPLFNGQFYFNAHTSLNGGGEIRGNLVPVPEPSTFALIGLGMGGLVCLLRRRTA